MELEGYVVAAIWWRGEGEGQAAGAGSAEGRASEPRECGTRVVNTFTGLARKVAKACRLSDAWGHEPPEISLAGALPLTACRTQTPKMRRATSQRRCHSLAATAGHAARSAAITESFIRRHLRPLSACIPKRPSACTRIKLKSDPGELGARRKLG